VLQKLFLWESMADSIEQFREKKGEALEKGWNSSGPVKAGAAFQAISREMEKKLMRRLDKGRRGR